MFSDSAGPGSAQNEHNRRSKSSSSVDFETLFVNTVSKLRQQAEAARELLMAGADADTLEDAVIATLINRAMEVVTQNQITPSLYREVVGLVVRLREQKISMERLRLERARFELDVANLVMKHIDKWKSSGVLQIEDCGEAAKKIRESIFGKYTKEQFEAAALAIV